MTYWAFNNMSPQIETILSKEDLTLYELLDQESLLQELKGQNAKLIEFLLRDDVLEELVTLVTQEPSVDINESERYKYASIACELLTCDIPVFNEKLSSNHTILDKLYSFLENENLLNPLLSSYFTRTFTILIEKKSEQNWYSYQVTCLQALEFMKTKNEFVNLLLRHIGTSSIMDLTLNLVTLIEGNEVKQNFRNWLQSSNIIPSLISLLSPRVDAERQGNAAHVLCDIICKLRGQQEFETADHYQDAERDSILELLESTNIIAFLLDTVLNVDQYSESGIVGGISVLLEILRPYSAPEPRCRRALLYSLDGVSGNGSNGSSVKTSSDVSPNVENAENSFEKLTAIVNGILPFLPQLHNVLINPPMKPAIRLTSGLIDPPFGKTRLHVVKLMTFLIGINNAAVNEELLKLSTAHVLLDLLFTYWWNSFLHTELEKCVAYTLDHYLPGEMSILSHLVGECQLLQKIMAAVEDNEACQQKGEHRRGYMGSLIQIASLIFLEERRNDDLRQLIEFSVPEEFLVKWRTFTDTFLRQIIELQSTPLGGGIHPRLLPPQPRIDEDDELMKTATLADLNRQVPSVMEVSEAGSSQIVAYSSNDDQLQHNNEEGFNVYDYDDETGMTEEQRGELFQAVCAQKWQSFNTDLNNLDEDRDYVYKDNDNNFVNSDDEGGGNDDDDDVEIEWRTSNENNTGNNPWLKIGNTENPWSSGTTSPEESDMNWATFEESFKADFSGFTEQPFGGSPTRVSTLAAAEDVSDSGFEMVDNFSTMKLTASVGNLQNKTDAAFCPSTENVDEIKDKDNAIKDTTDSTSSVNMDVDISPDSDVSSCNSTMLERPADLEGHKHVILEEEDESPICEIKVDREDHASRKDIVADEGQSQDCEEIEGRLEPDVEQLSKSQLTEQSQLSNIIIEEPEKVAEYPEEEQSHFATSDSSETKGQVS